MSKHRPRTPEFFPRMKHRARKRKQRGGGTIVITNRRYLIPALGVIVGPVWVQFAPMGTPLPRTIGDLAGWSAVGTLT